MAAPAAAPAPAVESAPRAPAAVSVFGEIKDVVPGLPPFVAATGLPYINLKEASGRWDPSLISLKLVNAKKSDKVKKPLYNVFYKDHPLLLQLGFAPIHHVQTRGEFTTTLSPLKAKNALPDKFEQRMDVLEAAFKGLAALLCKRIGEMHPECKDVHTKFMEPSAKPEFGTSLNISYHKSTKVRRVTLADSSVYGTTHPASVERCILKGAMHAPLVRLQVSAPEANGTVWFNFPANSAVVIGKPELLQRTPEREAAWLRAAEKYLAAQDFLAFFPARGQTPDFQPVDGAEAGAAAAEETPAKKKRARKPRAPRAKKVKVAEPEPVDAEPVEEEEEEVEEQDE